MSALDALARTQRICAVFTQPDRPAGRGQSLCAGPVKNRALELGLAVHQPVSFKTPETLELLRGLALDALVVVAYGDSAARRTRHALGWVASISMPRCCRVGAGPRRFSARYWPAIRQPASRSCAWTPASTPVPRWPAAKWT